MSTYVKADVFKSEAISDFHKAVNQRPMICVGYVKLEPQKETVILQRKNRKRCAGLLVSTRFRTAILSLVMIFLLGTNMQAQTMQYGKVDTATTTWNVSYEEFTATHIPLEMTHPSFPGWECWSDYDGLLYVVIQRKQSWLNRRFTYREWNCVILCVGLRE